MTLTITPSALRTLMHDHHDHAEHAEHVGAVCDAAHEQAPSFHLSRTHAALLAMADAAYTQAHELSARHTRFADPSIHYDVVSAPRTTPRQRT